jgi:hypothetical protein
MLGRMESVKEYAYRRGRGLSTKYFACLYTSGRKKLPTEKTLSISQS